MERRFEDAAERMTDFVDNDNGPVGFIIKSGIFFDNE